MSPYIRWQTINITGYGQVIRVENTYPTKHWITYVVQLWDTDEDGKIYFTTFHHFETMTEAQKYLGVELELRSDHNPFEDEQDKAGESIAA